MAKLREYRRKRDPKKTPEPFSGNEKDGKEPIFVIQRHDARRLHYDFRLERDGALASWAVPKGVPLEPGERHLAVHVEDHPLEYATFEGEIPKGQYGAGTVEIWDRGTYELVEEKRDGGLTVRLHGERLDGPLDARSRAARRQSEELAARPQARGRRGGRRCRGAATRRCSRRSPTRCRRGDGWLFEVKWDGYRRSRYVAGGEATLRSRKDKDSRRASPTSRRSSSKAVKTPDCVVDGEVCALDEQGRPSFSAMQQGKPGTPLVYYVFDLLELDGEPLVDLPLTRAPGAAREAARQAQPTVRLSETFDDGEALYAAAREQGLEGIMAKRAGLEIPARASASRDWLKIKTHGRQEFVIAGYTQGQGRRAGRFGSLVLAVQRRRRARVGRQRRHRLRRAEIERLLEAAAAARAQDVAVPAGPEDAAACARTTSSGSSRSSSREVEFAEWTHDGRLRAPVLPGAARGQGASESCGATAPWSPCRRDPARASATLQALQPRQAVLAGGGHHEGRPARLLPRCRGGARPAPARTGRSR